MIEIKNLTSKQIDEEFVKKIAERVLEKEGKRKVKILITFVGSGRIRKLNKKYFGKNRVANFLVFKGKPKLEDFSNLEGIFICQRELRKAAKRSNSTFEKELEKVLIEGILKFLTNS